MPKKVKQQQVAASVVDNVDNQRVATQDVQGADVAQVHVAAASSQTVEFDEQYIPVDNTYDQPVQPHSEAEQYVPTVANYVCPYCAAVLGDVSGIQQIIICRSCNKSVEFVARGNISSNSIKQMMSDKCWSGDIKAIKCNSCGAKNVYQQGQRVKQCPFCYSSELTEEQSAGVIAPDTVLPFTLKKAQAIVNCSKWIARKWLAPKQFKKALDVDNISGVYYPVWTFGTTTETEYGATMGTYHNIQVQLGKRKIKEQRVSWFTASGKLTKTFEDILIPGSQNIKEDDLRCLQPFDKRGYVKFDNSLLDEVCANCYTVVPVQAFTDAQSRMSEEIRANLIKQHNAEVVASMVLDIKHDSGKVFRYTMLPVYVSSIKYRNRVYNQYINGNSGKISGKRPISAIKVLLTTLITSGAAVGLLWLLNFLAAK